MGFPRLLGGFKRMLVRLRLEVKRLTMASVRIGHSCIKTWNSVQALRYTPKRGVWNEEAHLEPKRAKLALGLGKKNQELEALIHHARVTGFTKDGV